MADSVFLPQYKNSILSLSNTILKYYGVASSFTGLASVQQRLKKRPKNIVLWILDGLGVDLLSNTIAATSFLRQHVIQTLSSVFPPTTAAATTTPRSRTTPLRPIPSRGRLRMIQPASTARPGTDVSATTSWSATTRRARRSTLR